MGFFLNPLMLMGLAGVALPVLAHLLSKQKFDVVDWGAMQFLELGQRTRRRIKLEELILLLLRMVMIAIIVLALCRPLVSTSRLAGTIAEWAKWTTLALGILLAVLFLLKRDTGDGWSDVRRIVGVLFGISLTVFLLCQPFVPGGWLARTLAHRTRDVVLIIDGSYSLGWEGKAVTPHASAVQWAHKFLETLGPGDAVGLLDARDRVRAVVDPPSHDFAQVRKELDALPKPSGSSDLPESIAQGIRLLAKGENLAKELIVVTDGQARPWNPSDEARWELLDDLVNQQTVKPRLWVVDLGEGEKGDRTNFALDRPELSREFAAVNLPVRIRTKVRYTGGQGSLQRRVWLEADGQRLADASLQTPMMQPNGEFPVEFEHRFATIGSHRLSIVLDADNLPGDNRAEAAVTVADAIPVLLVDGDPHLDPTRSESFFARAALSAAGNDSPLVKATVIAPEGLTQELLDKAQVVTLMNVGQPTPAQADVLRNYVAAGGGLLVAPGEKVDAQVYNTLLYGDGTRVLPASLGELATDEAKPPAPGVSILDSSLKIPLVAPLRRERDGGFTDARFAKWWTLKPAPSAKEVAARAAPPVAAPAAVKASDPIVAARLSNNAPYLVLRTYGRGRVAQVAAPLDSDWSTLPAKPDYVSFLHELVFHLAGGTSPSRNVLVGEPLVMPVARGTRASQFVFLDPAGKKREANLGGDEARPTLQLDEADLPGTYRLVPLADADKPGAAGEQFVVEFNRTESDLKPLDLASRKLLAGKNRLTFESDVQKLTAEFDTDGPKWEIWRVLMALMMLFLLGELLLTRRLVNGGHVAGEELVDDVDLARAA